MQYCIAGKHSREKTFSGSKIFTEKTFTDCSLVLLLKDAMLPDFAEKTFANNYKTLKFVEVFSLESFPLYSICTA